MTVSVVGEGAWRQWGWVFLTGAMLFLIGVLGVASWFVVVIATMLFFGWLLLLGGVVQTAVAIIVRERTELRGQLFVGLLTSVVGFLILAYPLVSAELLAVVFVVFLLVHGLSLALEALVMRGVGWAWRLIAGLVSCGIGVVIWVGHPALTLKVVGLVIGFMFVFTGWAAMAMALRLRRATQVNQ
jgi:uncharacterized membrane protein HdeD (DUF308 family)